MTDATRIASEHEAPAPTESATSPSRLRRLGAAALTAGPLVFAAGLATSPAGDTTNAASSINAFATHGTQTQVSALLLHYGLMLMALGLLVVPSMVSSGRGRLLVMLGSLGTSIGMLNVSGTLKDDWWRMAAGQTLDKQRAIDLVEQAESASLLSLWTFTEMIAFLGVLLVLVGLGRARALSWAWTGAAVGALVATFAIPGDVQVWPSVAFGAFMLTLLPVGILALRTNAERRG